MSTTLRARVGLASFVVAILTAALLPNVAAAGSLKFSSMAIGENCIGIFAPPNSTVELIWKNAGGSVKADQMLAVNDSGTASYCAPGSSVVLTSGDRLKAIDGGTTHKLVVPELSIRLNRVTGVIRGTGPAGATVNVGCPDGLFPGPEGCAWHKRVRVDTSGNWSVRPPEMNSYQSFGGNSDAVDWHNGAGEHVFAEAIAPYVEIILGRSGISGAYQPNGTATVQVRNGVTNDLKATLTQTGSPLDGSFSGFLRDAGANKYPIAPGDHLVSNIASDADWVVPDIDGTASAATDVVSGHCYDAGSSDRLVEVWVYRNNKHFGPAVQDVDNDGAFSFNFHDDTWDSWRAGSVVRTGDTVWIMCMQARGDWVDTSIVGGS